MNHESGNDDLAQIALIFNGVCPVGTHRLIPMKDFHDYEDYLYMIWQSF